MSESVNPAVEAGNEETHTETAALTGADLDFHDPGEDNVAAEPQADDEPAQPEQAEATEEAQDAPEADEPAEPTLELPTGEKLPVKDVVAGYMKDADYRQKTAAVAEQRRAVETVAGNVGQLAEALVDGLLRSLPPEPDMELASTDPGEHYRMSVARQAGERQIEALLGRINQMQGAIGQLSDAQRAEILAAENAKLVKAHPETAEQKGRDAFFAAAHKAAEALGYSRDEVAMATDARLFRLAYYAQKGLDAEAATEKTRAALAKAPAIPKPRANAIPDAGYQAKRSRFHESGSLEDALALDF